MKTIDLIHELETKHRNPDRCIHGHSLAKFGHKAPDGSIRCRACNKNQKRKSRRKAKWGWAIRAYEPQDPSQ